MESMKSVLFLGEHLTSLFSPWNQSTHISYQFPKNMEGEDWMISQQKKPEHLHSYHTTNPLSAAVFNQDSFQAEIKHKNSIHHYEPFKNK